MRDERLSIFFTAPNIHPTATGEEFVAWKWAVALSELVDLTVFAFQRANRQPLGETLPKARVMTVPMPRHFARFPRFEAMAKPHYPHYMHATRRALRQAGSVDLAHQIMPQALRYPCPLHGQGVPYVLGPLGGTLVTPEAFRSEGRKAAWYTRFRAVDHWRLRHDPWLRRTYSDANLMLGVAPYVKELLYDISLRRFESIIELGIDGLPPVQEKTDAPSGEIKLLHVGRGVRTKGLRDVIRAMGQLKDILPELRLTSAGAGEEIDICRREAEELGIADRVQFLGLIPRQEVDALYRNADIFVFPSYREPAGNVLYEAMSWGLPVITAARGGPDFIIDDETGIRIAVTEPGRYARDVAAAIRLLAEDPEKRRAMGAAGRAKLERIGPWPVKARNLVNLYREILSEND